MTTSGHHVPAASAAALPSIDAFVTMRTKLALWTTPGVRGSTVHVDTAEGLVTLYGKVPTEAQRVLAGQTAAAVEGVLEVKNLLQVVPKSLEQSTSRSDQELKLLVETELLGDAEIHGSQISVKSVDKGLVLLAGEARSYSEHLRACACVDHVAGVVRTASEVSTPNDFFEDERLTFQPAKPVPAGSGAAKGWGLASDTRISIEVKVRLLTAPWVPSREISVDTEEGVVTLFGIVPTDDVKTAVSIEAGKVAGVRQVNNQLEVVPTAAKLFVDANDADVMTDLGLAFRDLPELGSVTTTVKNGAVLLTGTVARQWDQLHALRVVWSARGVRAVESQLKVLAGP